MSCIGLGGQKKQKGEKYRAAPALHNQAGNLHREREKERERASDSRTTCIHQTYDTFLRGFSHLISSPFCRVSVKAGQREGERNCLKLSEPNSSRHIRTHNP